ncbi:Vacuolar fusion protein [Quillaja saponaria]|uniref:Vacuolar fusion protein n=1 Tax=Quillaja saponaria TaxID=32244 RepID=A0AAD7Q8G3_QUISA|nr:Vacuolar fusion protein [Quillaja saponaria]
MVLNSGLAVKVANVSADVCQYIACNPERLSTDTVLQLLFCFPLQELRTFTISLWTFLRYRSYDDDDHRRQHDDDQVSVVEDNHLHSD